MTTHIFTLVALILNFIGTSFLVFDSVRISRRILRKGITLGDDDTMQRWRFRYASAIGFGLLFLSFFFQAYVAAAT
jgi:hypothetical protein